MNRYGDSFEPGFALSYAAVAQLHDYLNKLIIHNINITPEKSKGGDRIWTDIESLLTLALPLSYTAAIQLHD